MNTSSRTFPHRIMALLLSIVMALSLLTIPPRSVQAGMMPSSLVSALGKVALSAVQSSVGWGLCELSDVTQNDTMASAFSYTRALIVGRQRVLTEQNIELVQELAASLDALYDYTVQSSNDISTMIKNLTWKSAKDTFDKNAGIPVDNFTSDFKNIGGYFNDLINAYAAYCDDPSEDHRSDLETLYFKVYGTYFLSRDYDDLTDQVNTLFKVPMLGDSTHTGFLSLISPYDYTQPIESTADMCDPDSDSWVLRGGASTDTTYLGYYRTYITQVTNFQNNVYDSMVDAAALVDNAAYLYLQAYRSYCEFQAMLYAGDASLSERDVRMRTTLLWDDFYDIAHKLIRAINQMYYTQQDVFCTYMRTSDVTMTRSIEGYKSPIPFDEMLHEYENANGYDGIIYPEHDVNYGGKTPTTKMYTNVIKEDQHIYQFRLASDPAMIYAIRTSSSDIDENNPTDDIVSQAFLVRDMVMIAPMNGANDRTIPSTDVFTVLKPLEGGFLVPKSLSELGAIAEGTLTSYDTAETLTQNIQDELEMALGTDHVHLPNVTFEPLSTDTDDILYGPNLMPLRTRLKWDMLYEHPILNNPDALMVLANASMPYSANNQAEFDMEDDIRDCTGSGRDKHLQSSEAVVMWVSDGLTSSVSLDSSGGGSTSVTVGDQQLGAGQSGTFSAGSAMTIRAVPSDGYTISSVHLVDRGGNELESLLDDAVITDKEGNVTATISTQEMLQAMRPNADGAYEFQVPVPCRDATVQVAFEQSDPSLIAYDVTLHDDYVNSSYDAVLQFSSYDYLSKKSFTEGSQVVVSVTGYNHHMPDGITITDESGREVDVAYEDATSDMKRIRPTERVYSFTMPARNLNVAPILKASYTVHVDHSASVTHTFEDLDLFSFDDNTDWSQAKDVDFATGDAVGISFETDSKTVVSGIDVYDSPTHSIQTTPSEGRIDFTMTGRDVTVSFSEEDYDRHAGILTLDPLDGQMSLRFVNQYGDDLNLVSKQFEAGDTVTVLAVLDDQSSVYPAMVLTTNGSNNIFATQEGTFDADTGLVTFTMPATNATLTAQMLDKPHVTATTSHDGASLEFQDKSGNALEGTMRGFVPGQTVRARLQASDALMFQEMVLTSDGGTENLFDQQGGTFDEKTGLVTFTMTDEDVTLTALMVEKPHVTLDTSHDGATFAFVDEGDNTLEGTVRPFFPGQTVRARLQTTDLLVPQEIVLTADGDAQSQIVPQAEDAKNLFDQQGGTFDEKTGLVTFTMPEVDATLSATFTTLTPEQVDGFDTDDEGRILIRSYEDLVRFSDAIRKRPDHYATASLVQTNNIVATGKESWTQGIGHYTEGIYFNGTYEGNGYCIFGMDLSPSYEWGGDWYAGLFEAIGETGVVRNLYLFDCDYHQDTTYGGGIAALNYGRIEYCVNGINPTNGIYVNPNTGALISLSDYNSYVAGNTAGAIVAVNHGTIYACRSAADVAGWSVAGGIAGTNSGTISNCVSTGYVKSTHSESTMDHNMGYYDGSGGLVGENYGTVEGGYSSATVSAHDAAGSIAFMQGGLIQDTFYTTSEGQSPFEVRAKGMSSTETNVGGLTRDEMKHDSFVAALADTSSNSVTWIRNVALNAGLPLIKNPSSSFADAVLSSNGLSVRGNLHTGTTIAMTELANNSEAWQLLAKDAGGYVPTTAYACEVQDAAGNHIPSELWVQSELTYTIPVRSPDVAINVLLLDGTTERVDNVEVDRGANGYTASFTADGVEAIMVLQRESATRPTGTPSTIFGIDGVRGTTYGPRLSTPGGLLSWAGSPTLLTRQATSRTTDTSADNTGTTAPATTTDRSRVATPAPVTSEGTSVAGTPSANTSTSTPSAATSTTTAAGTTTPSTNTTVQMESTPRTSDATRTHAPLMLLACSAVLFVVGHAVRDRRRRS